MLRDPELNEAHQSLQNLPPARLGGLELHHYINELTMITMLLLRAVDRLAEDQGRIRDLRDLIAKHHAYVSRKIDDLHLT